MSISSCVIDVAQVVLVDYRGILSYLLDFANRGALIACRQDGGVPRIELVIRFIRSIR
jgi:hypothetical protein